MQELSLNLLDIAQNSIAANATTIRISLAESIPDDLISIQISDNGRGMSPEQLSAATDPFFSTRQTRDIGLGLPLFKFAAELSGGHFSIVSKPGAGTSVSAAFRRSHIDCAPIGDIAHTLSILICLNDSVNFIFTRSFNNNIFSVSTEELKSVLDGVPLNDPRVISFVSDYIRENSDELLRR